MVAAAEQRCPGRRTQAGRMKPRVAQTTTLQPLSDRSLRRTTKRTRGPEPDIVEQDRENVRSALRGQQRLDRRKRRVRILRVVGQKTEMLPIPLTHPHTKGRISMSTPPEALQTATPLRRSVRLRTFTVRTATSAASKTA
jgi:hypothetical protein